MFVTQIVNLQFVDEVTVDVVLFSVTEKSYLARRQVRFLAERVRK